jgi:hypothetical protein
MGAHPYWYFVKYDPDIGKALQMLREREFRAGRYNPVMPFPPFPVTTTSPAPGAKHASFEDAMEASGADGTRSIIDIFRGVGEVPDFCTASPLPAATLGALYGTQKPSGAMVENGMEFAKDIERLHCTYVVLWKDEAPDEILFFGYSAD